MFRFLKTIAYKASRLFVLAILFLVSPFGVQITKAQTMSEMGEALINGVTEGIGKLLAYIAEFIFFASAWLTAKIGGILDWAVDEFILRMSSSVESIGAIDALWEIFRDLGNIVFIFLLLYAAISFILNTSQFNAKKILARVVIVALFVNFSLFATKVVIDTSNVLALQFYENIVVTEEAGQPPTGEGENARLSSVIAAQMNLSSTQSGSALEGIENVETSDDEDPYYKLALARMMGAVFILTAGFIMLALAALIIIRFFVLIFLMIASPIAFIAWTLPSNSFGEKWWSQLLSQSFFAPAVMGMLYVTFKVGNSFKQSGLVESNDLIAAITAPEQNVSLLVFFAVMMGMLIASLMIAKQMGAVGANKAVAVGKSTSNWASGAVAGGAAGTAAWAGRNTAGRTGQRLSESETLKEHASGKRGNFATKWAARATLGASNKTAEKSFDLRNTKAGQKSGASDVGQRSGGFREVIEEKQEEREEQKEQIEALSPQERAAAESAKMEKKQIENMKEEIDNKMSDINSAINERNKIRNKLAEAQKNDNEELEDQLEKQISQLRDNIIPETDGVEELDDLEDKKAELKRAEEAHKDRQRNLEQIINVGKERGEAFVEEMLDQQSVLDQIDQAMSNTVNKLADRQIFGAQDDLTKTTQTRANNAFAMDNVDSIESEERHSRVTETLDRMQYEQS